MRELLKSGLLVLCLALGVGCGTPRHTERRYDGPPFKAGDVVWMKPRNGFSWTVEKVEGDKVHVIREPITHGFLSTSPHPTERQIYPGDILERRVEWWSDEPEPERR